MKIQWNNLRSVIIFCALALAAGCGDFGSSFNEINPEILRVIDFGYQNNADTALCEAMPGDTMRLLAYFAGEKISSLDWQVSFNVEKNEITGADSAFDVQPLNITTFPVDVSIFSSATQCVGIKFKIPEDIMHRSKSVYDDGLAAVGLTREQALFYIEKFIQRHHSPGSSLQPSSIDSMLIANRFLLMQIFSVPVRIFLKVNGLYPIRSDFTVRYNRFFNTLQMGYVNRNPTINFITLYKIKSRSVGGLVIPDSMHETDTTYCLYIKNSSFLPFLGKNIIFTDTIGIDTTTFRYYFASDTGVIGNVDQRDSTISFGGHPGQERFSKLWFYEYDQSEVQNVIEANKLSISGGGGFLNILTPPKDRKITQAILWLQMFDRSNVSERNRPQGSNIREKKIFFKYQTGRD
jgi:hypothetical protein